MDVVLSKEEKQYAHKIGVLRTEENAGVGDIGDYDQRRFNLTSKQNNAVAVVAEMAVAKFLGYDPMNMSLDQWASFVPRSEYSKYLSAPDFPEHMVEVRRANRFYNPLPARDKDRGQGVRIIQVFVDYTQTEKFGPIMVSPVVTLTGWADVDSDWHKGTVPSWSANGDSRVLPKRAMNEWAVKV